MISSSGWFIIKGAFQESAIVHSFEVIDLVLFVSGSYLLNAWHVKLFSYVFALEFVEMGASSDTS
jgi:hypothetical protein